MAKKKTQKFDRFKYIEAPCKCCFDIIDRKSFPNFDTVAQVYDAELFNEFLAWAKKNVLIRSKPE